MTKFDYIIVGAGAAGCVLANRLAQNGEHQVLLIEAGGPDKHPMIAMPKGIAKVLANARYTWPFQIEAEAASNGVDEFWLRGRTLGGSTAVNGMMYVRGQSADFDALAEVSSDEWSWSKIGPCYREMENHQLGAAATRGDSGPLKISLPEHNNPLIDQLIASGKALGLTVKDDVNEPDDCQRIGYAGRTIYQGRRQSAATAFLQPVRHCPNLHIATHVTVDKVLFDQKRAVAVNGYRHGELVQFNASREVIVCAGALASPAILQRSGIGSATALKALGIAVVHNNPSVGHNLREHRGLVMQWRVADQLSENSQYRGFNLIKNVVHYFLAKKGPLAAGAYEAGAWFKSRPELPRPDGQMLFAPFSFDYSLATLDVEKQGGFNCVVYPLRPESTGSVLIKSASPDELPHIQANYSSHPADREKMIDIVRFARSLVAGAFTPDQVSETRPGPEYQTDQEITLAHKKFGYTSYHASGTCRMGNDSDSVVDPQLKVRGVTGLRVVDTSVFPFILSGNTAGPAMVVAWRAAQLIQADQSIP